MAYDCIDMKVQLHINDTDEPNWYRCKQVEFTGETATWELSRTGKYGLLAAYQMAPHRQLVQATNDDALRAFVRAWGPLRMSLDSWTGSDPIIDYRHKRDHFRAWVLLLTAIQKNEGLHDTVLDLLRQDPKSFAIPIMGHLGFPVEPNAGFNEADWKRLANTSKSEIVWICDFLVGAFPVSSLAHSLSIKQTRKKLQLAARPKFMGLTDALYWMVWQDIFMDNPFQFCVECGKLIPFTSRHARRFCPDGCAHRRTAREWQQRKREKERKANGLEKAQ
jgi:hypothetical protein